MAAWYGYPYERLPGWLKVPAKGAILGGIIGVFAGLLTGLNPILFGVSLIAAGAAIGLAVGNNEERQPTDNASRHIDQSIMCGHHVTVERDCGDEHFQKLLAQQQRSRSPTP